MYTVFLDTINGNLLEGKGFELLREVFYNYIVYAFVCIGVWTDETYLEYNIDEEFEYFQNLYIKTEERRLNSDESNHYENYRKYTESSDYLGFVAATIGPRSVNI